MKIDFEFDSPYGKFADALYFADDAIPDDATLETLKQERLNNWLALITAPVVEEPVVEEPVVDPTQEV